MHTFKLTVFKDHSELLLLKEGARVASKSWPESRDMGRQLFEAIQSLLAENGLKPAQIKDFTLETSLSDNSTSVKIAQTVQKTFLFTIKMAQKSQKA